MDVVRVSRFWAERGDPGIPFPASDVDHAEAYGVWSFSEAALDVNMSSEQHQCGWRCVVSDPNRSQYVIFAMKKGCVI